MKIKKMVPRIYQFNNIEDRNGNYLYKTEYGHYVYNGKKGIARMSGNFPELVKYFFGKIGKF